MDNELLQLCLDLVNSSYLSVTNKQAWQKRLKENGIDKETFEYLQSDIRKTNAGEQQKLNYELQEVVDDIDDTIQDFTEKFNNLSSKARESSKEAQKRRDETALAKIRAKLGM
jgi:hypothetical protein